MKRKLALLLAMTVMTTSLYACGKLDETDKDTNSDKTGQAQVEVETEPEEKAEEPSTPTYALTSVNADGYEYFTGGVQCIQITDNKHPKLAEAIDKQFSDLVSDFNSGVDEMNEDAKQMNEENRKYAEEDPDMEYTDMSYSHNCTVEVIRSDSKIFSFVLYDYLYTGGAHGMTDETGYTYDSTTGELLELSNFGDEQAIKDTALAYIKDIITQSEQSAKDSLFTAGEFTDDYDELLDSSFEGDNVPAYYLDNRGLVFVFQQYAIAPYAAGIITFTVPYEKIEGFNEKYIPEDEFYSVDLSALGFIDEIDANGDGELEKVYLVNNNDEYTICAGDKEVSEKVDDYAYVYGTYIHSKSGNFVLASISGEKLALYDISNGVKKVGELETTLSIKEIKDGEIVLAEANYDSDGVTWGTPETHKYSKSGLE